MELELIDGVSNEEEEINAEVNEEVIKGEESVVDTDDDIVVVTIDGESAPGEEDHSQAPDWVRELRKSDREKSKKIRELELKLQSSDIKDVKQSVLGVKPTLEGFDYDEDAYESGLAMWYDQKRAVEDQKAKQEQDAKESETAWQAKLSSYAESKAKLKVIDFEDAEESVQTTFTVTQQGIILQGADNPALLIYALGKNPKKAKELASITDPVKYTFAIAKLESQLKVTPRKAPPPERVVTGSGSLSASTDGTLNRLRDEAEKTGDYTKVMQYKRSKK